MRTLIFVLGLCLVGCTPRPPSVVTPQQIHQAINFERSKGGLAPLQFDPLLMKAAQDYAEAMQKYGEISHDIDGQTLQLRLQKAGYKWSYAGENIAVGYGDTDSLVRAWLNSAAHRVNITESSYRETGIGVAGKYYCQIFAHSNKSVTLCGSRNDH